MADPYYTPLALSELTDRVRALETKNKTFIANEGDFRKRIEMLEAQFDLQGARIILPQLYEPQKVSSPGVMAHTVDLNDFWDKFNEIMWEMLEIIGTTGVARYPDIRNLVLEQMPDLTENRIRRTAYSLEEMNVLNCTELRLPLTPQTMLYSITDIGERLFHKKFKVWPVPSEMVRVIKEHDNIEHGYGILELGQFLATSGKYKNVSTFNRTRPVKFTNGTQYIPDIVCTDCSSKDTAYFEYERGTHMQKDFNTKLDKMCRTTQYLNIVAQNKEVLVKHLIPQVETWTALKGQCDISETVIRLTTPKAMQTCHLSDESWLVVYELCKSIKSVICKVKLD